MRILKNISFLTLLSLAALSNPVPAERGSAQRLRVEKLEKMDAEEALELVYGDEKTRIIDLESMNWSDEKTMAVMKAAKEFRDDEELLWSDTVLEGGVELDSEIMIDSVEVILVDNRVFGYKVSISATAYDINGDEPLPGTVSSAGFVSRKLEVHRIGMWIAEFND